MAIRLKAVYVFSFCTTLDALALPDLASPYPTWQNRAAFYFFFLRSLELVSPIKFRFESRLKERFSLSV
jgi:hypothetical protein